MPTQVLAVSNLTSTGRRPAVGMPADEQYFPSLQAARDWLRGLGCGGAISDLDKLVEEIPPGA